MVQLRFCANWLILQVPRFRLPIPGADLAEWFSSKHQRLHIKPNGTLNKSRSNTVHTESTNPQACTRIHSPPASMPRRRSSATAENPRTVASFPPAAESPAAARTPPPSGQIPRSVARSDSPPASNSLPGAIQNPAQTPRREYLRLHPVRLPSIPRRIRTVIHNVQVHLLETCQARLSKIR